MDVPDYVHVHGTINVDNTVTVKIGNTVDVNLDAINGDDMPSFMIGQEDLLIYQ